MTLYLDASVLAPTLVREAATPVVYALLSATEDLLIVSDFAAAEVSSALSRLTRTGFLQADEAGATLEAFDAWRGEAMATSRSRDRIHSWPKPSSAGLSWPSGRRTRCMRLSVAAAVFAS